jgi:hypothetical protein
MVSTNSRDPELVGISGTLTEEDLAHARRCQAGRNDGPLTPEEKELILTDPNGEGYKKVLARRGRTCS